MGLGHCGYKMVSLRRAGRRCEGVQADNTVVCGKAQLIAKMQIRDMKPAPGLSLLGLSPLC